MKTGMRRCGTVLIVLAVMGLWLVPALSAQEEAPMTEQEEMLYGVGGIAFIVVVIIVIAMVIKLEGEIWCPNGISDKMFDIRIRAAFKIGKINDMQIPGLPCKFGSLHDFSPITPKHIFMISADINSFQG